MKEKIGLQADLIKNHQYQLQFMPLPLPPQYPITPHIYTNSLVCHLPRPAGWLGKTKYSTTLKAPLPIILDQESNLTKEVCGGSLE